MLDPADWNEDIARGFAAMSGIVLTEAHWEIVRFLRDYHERYRHVPNMRMFVKAIRTTLGDEKGNSHYLHRLFPEGPLKLACRIAGLPKPPACL